MRMGILNPDQRVAFLPSNMKTHLAPLFPKIVTRDLHRVQQDLALLFILASGNDLLPSLEKTSFNALWIAYQAVINSMAEMEETPVPHLLDVAASKLNLETFARVLEKAEQLVADGVVYMSGRVSDAYLKGFLLGDEHSSHAYVPVQAEPLESESNGLEDLDALVAVRNDVTKFAPKLGLIEDAPAQKRNEEASRPLEQSNVSDVEDSVVSVIGNKRANSPVSVQVRELSSEQNENVSLYMDIILWTLLGSTRGLTRDYRLMYFKKYGPTASTLRKWIVTQLAEGKQAVFWDGPKAVSLKRNALVIPPEECQVVHSSFSKHISEFTQRLQTEQDQSADAALPYRMNTRSTDERALIPNKKETLLRSILSFETGFQTMDTESALQLYQPALKFATPCRARFADSVKGLLTEKRAKMTVDGSLLPTLPSTSTMNIRQYRDDNITFLERRTQGVCFEVMEEKTGKWVWVRDVTVRAIEAKNAIADSRVNVFPEASNQRFPSGLGLMGTGKWNSLFHPIK
ncbi:hypothetical protein HDU81_001695 [Chytriomyces hyalinus]|nr:hypothetical protein HDU81_001695 [Chytriomyces hyalinus]